MLFRNSIADGHADVLTRCGIALAGAAVPLAGFGRAALGVAAVLAALALLATLDGRQAFADLKRAFRSPLGWCVAIVFVAWIPSVLVSIDIGKSAVVWLRMWVFLGGAFLVANALRRDPALVGLFLRSLAAATLAMCLLLAPAFFGAPEWVSFIRLKGWSDVNPRDVAKAYGSVAACLAPLLVLAACRFDGAWRYTAAAAVAALAWIAWIGEGRAGQVGLIAAAFVFIAIPFLARRATVVTGIAGLCFAAGFAFVVWFSQQSIGDHWDAATYPLPTWGQDLRNNHPGPLVVQAHRESIWLFALQRAREAPIFGIGIDAINKVPGADTVIPAFGQAQIPSHPHSWAVEILAETGWTGLLALAAALLAAIHLYMRHYAATRDVAALAGTGVLVGFWTSSLFNFSIWSSWWQICFLFLTAAALAAMRREDAASGSFPTTAQT